MPIPRKELPNVGEYVIATVKEIFDYGAYVTLDEYNGLEAYLPWSEVASRWVRNIRDVIRENQKIVVKVIRVNRRRKTVDVSLKKVPENEKRRKMLWWKRYLKASKIVELVAEKIGKSIEDAYREVVWKLEDYYGDPLLGLEEAVIRGPDALREAGIPEEWIEPLYNEALRHVKVKMVKIRGLMFLRSYESDGVERIKKILLSAKEILDKVGDNVKGRIYLLGSPRYVIEIIAPDYKEAEKVLKEILTTTEKLAKELKVEFRFERERK
ncbi:translation initiation factor 2 subunit alpha (aeIF-2a) [Staphylothermus marinus F1]|uniref:Translation initiation factor 2 subunit alpha n=1 Tax=Staphylothermus marinus (strain ATCC 43588 / DSM 3639 / JCM 9404 / F1) TaxID=399550 RepID=IF2A_STAMF|nr:translation initiation factor IF-2 subunit alpha [Staphylothermus marinus]A3DM89.1 RecName: Full=Translation initiation factor 2 subunit alpha; AltName: Full=aIF2-alpha; AltName: Full=eIF-2-alpha [Staphylothermus marinus F1]ABN69749.1 translation initiation factor 2 subunit alpha (aeIF-2a) [Staphylothermus marinus F1]